jgi:mannose-6-phosphate isomerase-like protein (cupin superfamily)
MSLPLILVPGEGRSVQIGTTVCTFKATGNDTHGHFGLFEWTMSPGTPGPSPHIHKKLIEMFYVVEGGVELLLDRRRVLAPPCTFMLVPEHTPHAFSNPGQKQSKMLIMFCPAESREGYFEGLAELTKSGRQPSKAEIIELMLKYDSCVVSDPTTSDKE